MDKDANESDATQDEVRNAITAFEQILEAIPNDRFALETLCDAYDQIGDPAKSLEYLLRLAHAIIEESDKNAAPNVLEKLRAKKPTDAAAGKVVSELEQLVGASKPRATAKDTRKGEPMKRKGVDITAELALAWNLTQAGVLNQADYSSVVHDLTESSTKKVDVPVSVLHVLHDRSFKNIDKVMVFLSSDSGLPILSLATFELQKDAYSLLPMEFMQHRGAIVFEQMAKDLLVAILNPYDTELRDDVKKLSGRNCHFYLVTAESYDGYLHTIRTAIQAAEAAAKEAAAKKA